MPTQPPTQQEPQSHDQAASPYPQEHQQNQERPPYPRGVPLKFTPSGDVQSFAGNTILSHLSADCPLRTSLVTLHSLLAAHPFSQQLHNINSNSSHDKLYTLLPPASWHVTLFEGVCDRVRLGGHPPGVFWPAALPADVELGAVTALFAAKLRGCDLGEGAPPYKMRVVGFSPLEVGIGVAVEPATVAEAGRIKGLRDRLSQALGVRHPGHDTYGLHVSLAYLLRHLSAEQEAELRGLLYGFLEGGGMAREFELGAPEFCMFGDMFEFRRLFYLGEGRREDGDELS